MCPDFYKAINQTNIGTGTKGVHRPGLKTPTRENLGKLFDIKS